MHHHARLHVVDPEIIVVAVSQRRDTRQRPLLRVGDRDAALLHRCIFFLDDTERQFGHVPQFDLLLLIEAGGQFARVEKRNSDDADETEADQGINLPADGHLEPTQYRIRQRTTANETCRDGVFLRLPGAHQRIDVLGFRALLGGQLGADRHIAGDLTIFPNRRGAGPDPIKIPVLATVLDRAGPRHACLDGGPEVLKRFRRHVGMANDVVRLPHQFRLRVAGGIHELLVEIGELTLCVCLRDDHGIVVDRILDIGDRKIATHLFWFLREGVLNG